MMKKSFFELLFSSMIIWEVRIETIGPFVYIKLIYGKLYFFVFLIQDFIFYVFLLCPISQLKVHH